VTAIQVSVSEGVQSSVMALLGAINQVMPAVGFLLGGLLTTLASPRTTYAAAGIGVLLALMIALARPPQGLEAAAGALSGETSAGPDGAGIILAPSEDAITS